MGKVNKGLNRLITTTVVASLSSFISLQALAFDQFITVKFKKPVTDSFIKELNKMTNTTVSQKSGNTYKLKIGGVANNNTLDRYSEMFAIMKNVENISPLPKEKIADKVNPYYYFNMSVNEGQDTTDKSAADSNAPAPVTQVVPDELIVKFNKDTSAADIENINKNLGGEVTYMKENDSYKIKLPEYVNDEYAMNFYSNNRMVQSVEQNTVTATPDPKASGNPTNKSVTQQSGVALAIPLSGRDVKVTFKIGKETEGMKWFGEVFGSELVSKKGYHTFVLRFPGEINPKFVARALKACPIVSSSEVSSD